MSGIWVKFIMLWTFQSPKNCNYFKSRIKHKNNDLKFKIYLFIYSNKIMAWNGKW
jgi:hypothetical protein